MNQNSQEPVERIHHQIRKLASVYRNAVRRFGITENEFLVWYTLIIIGGEHSQQDICGTWLLSKQTVNSIIQNMVQKGFAYLELVPGTRNLKKIHLTQRGKQYGEDMITPISDAENRTISRIAEKDWEFCTTVLSSYIRMFEEEMYGAENK